MREEFLKSNYILRVKIDMHAMYLATQLDKRKLNKPTLYVKSLYGAVIYDN